MVDYIKRGRDRSLLEIGFADHLPLLTREDPTLAMPLGELAGYIEAVELLKKDFPDIAIKTGIEADYFPGMEADTRRLLEQYKFDYVIGSIHFIDGWGFDDSRYIEGYEGRDIYELYEGYFELVVRAASSGLFDIVGHLDLIKKYNFRPKRDITSLVEEVILAIKDTGVCVEINTAGLRKPAAEMYPSDWILELCARAGIPVTLGSDAHSPGQVGMDFDLALASARRAGYDRIAVFERRERGFIALR
jgi:histidinol-phosphatase (PHP family)